MRSTPGREQHIPHQTPNIPNIQIFNIQISNIPNMKKVCPFKRNMLTAKGQHFICPFNVGYILYQQVILASRVFFFPEKRVIPRLLTNVLLKGHTNPYLVRDVWYLVLSQAVPLNVLFGSLYRPSGLYCLCFLLKGNKGQNQYLNCVFMGKIQVTFRKCILYPYKVIFEIALLKV